MTNDMIVYVKYANRWSKNASKAILNKLNWNTNECNYCCVNATNTINNLISTV